MCEGNDWMREGFADKGTRICGLVVAVVVLTVGDSQEWDLISVRVSG